MGKTKHLPKQKLVFETTDCRGYKVVFTQQKLEQKAITHPELRKPTFVKNVERTIREPDEIWQDFGSPKQKACYYRKYSTVSYIKVVVYTKSNPYTVITAYEINYIKEAKYPNLKRIR